MYLNPHLRNIFKALNNTKQEQSNEREQRRIIGDGQRESTKDVSSTTEGNSGTISRNSSEDSGNEETIGSRKTIASSEAVPTTTEEVKDGVVTVLKSVKNNVVKLITI